MVGSEPVDLDKTYRLCTKDYLARGKDGYDCLAGSQVIVNDEDGPQLSTIIQNHFQSVGHLSGLCQFKYYHHQSIISRCVRRSLSRQASVIKEEPGGSRADHTELRPSEDGQSDGRRRWQTARIALAFARHCTIQEAESKEVEVALAPKIQQRIRNVTDGPV